MRSLVRIHATTGSGLKKTKCDGLRRSPTRLFMPTVVALVSALLLLNGCIFKEVKEQQKKLDAHCTLQGQVRAGKPGKNPLVVVLVRLPGGRGEPRANRELADHYVLEGAGTSASGGGTAGAQAAKYHKGMAVFTHAKGGLMYEASVAGQKFSYKPLKK